MWDIYTAATILRFTEKPYGVTAYSVENFAYILELISVIAGRLDILMMTRDSKGHAAVVRRVPQRTCVGCRSVRDKRELVRLADDLAEARKILEGITAEEPGVGRVGKGTILV